jgi:hypothetical protein
MTNKEVQMFPEVKPLQISEANLPTILDISQDLFRHSTGPVNVKLLLFQALHDYLVRHGVNPGFEVSGGGVRK